MKRMIMAMLVATALVVARGAAPDAPEQVDVFVAGAEGYHTYRIPSVICTPTGALLAFCEGRKNNRGDAGDIDLVLRRSRDGGKTWGPLQMVWDDGVNTCGNPCPVVDRDTGVIWLLLTHNLREDTEAKIVSGASKSSRTVWVSHSRDDGRTWARPTEITSDVKLTNWTWYATGPGIGIQLKSGRLLIPCDNKVAGTIANQSHVIYSDDHGATWRLGGIVGPDFCNESQAVELSDGSVMLNMRSTAGKNRRMVATSKDRGLTFTAPRLDDALIEPVCQASLISTHGLLIFSNPASTRREKMTVRMSSDDGKSWTAGRLLHAGPAAYSCLTVLDGSTLGCLYERGEGNPYERITFARFARDERRGEQ